MGMESLSAINGMRRRCERGCSRARQGQDEGTAANRVMAEVALKERFYVNYCELHNYASRYNSHNEA